MKFTYRGLELDDLLKLPTESLESLFRSRIRRKLRRSKGFKGKYLKLLTKLRNSKKNLQPGEKPPMIKTHLRNCVVTPENDRINCRSLYRKGIQASRSQIWYDR